MQLLKEKLRLARDALEVARGRAIWLNVPLELRDALDDSLFSVNKATQVAEQFETSFNKEKVPMKELFAMLETFKTVKASAIATTERLSKVGGACDKLNADLDGFFEAAGMAEGEFVGEEGAACEGSEQTESLAEDAASGSEATI